MEKLPSCSLPRCGASTRRELFQEGSAARHRLANISELGKNFDSERPGLLFWGRLGHAAVTVRLAPVLRIASLVPSLTELAFALGLGERLVARTGFCVHPGDRVGAVAKVGGTKDVNLAKLRG